MKKTQHYGLCQWDGEDRILREDFNEDNAKLDTAIAEVKERNYFEKLADVTTTQSCQQLDVDLSGGDFTQYDRLIIHAVLKSDTVHLGYLRLNGISDSAAYNRSEALASFCTVYNSGTGMGDLELILGPVILGVNRYTYQQSSNSEQLANQALVVVTPGRITAETLRQLNFYCFESRPVLTGSQVIVYGVRK